MTEKKVRDDSLIFVSGTTLTDKLGKSISLALEAQGTTRVRCIGANAGWQAIKGIIVAKSILAANNYEVRVEPYFVNVQTEDKEVTAVEYKLSVVNG